MLKKLMFLTAFVWCLTTMADAATTWRTVAPAKAGFSAEMPGTPRAEQSKDKDGTTTYTWTVEASPVVYMATSVTMPAGADAQTILDAFCEGVAEGGKVVAKRAITIQGQPGRILMVDQKKDELTARARLVLVEHQIYCLMSISSPEAATNKNIDHFLQSLKLIEPGTEKTPKR